MSSDLEAENIFTKKGSLSNEIAPEPSRGLAPAWDVAGEHTLPF
jgi:hypothetical protein